MRFIHWTTFPAVIAILAIFLPGVAEARPGQFDHQFGKKGIAKVPLTAGHGEVVDLERGPDNRLYLAGLDGQLPLLAALDHNGKPAGSFGVDGLSTDFPLPECQCQSPITSVVSHGTGLLAAAESSDISILTSYDRTGERNAANTGLFSTTRNPRRIQLTTGARDGSVLAVSPRGLLSRIRPNRKIDRSFGRNGVLDIRDSLGVKSGMSIEDAAVTPRGKIVLAGTRNGPRFKPQHVFVVRLLRNGQRDRSFGKGGRGFVKGKIGIADAVATLPNGAIVTLSTLWPRRDLQSYRAVITKLRRDGRVAGGFAKRAPKPLGRVGTYPNDLAARGGKLVAVMTKAKRTILARLGYDGSLDRSFAHRGRKVTSRFQVLPNRTLAVDRHARITVAGYTGSISKEKPVVARIKGR